MSPNWLRRNEPCRDDEVARSVLHRLADDESPLVRQRLWHQLFRSRGAAGWRTELVIELTDVARPDYVAAIARGQVESSELDAKVASLVREKALASAEEQGVDEQSAQQALRQLDALGFDLTFEWVLRRLEWVRRGDRETSYRDVPDGVIALLSSRRGKESWRDELQRLADFYETPNLPYGIRSAIARSIAALGGDSQELTELIRRWASQNEDGVERASEVYKHQAASKLLPSVHGFFFIVRTRGTRAAQSSVRKSQQC